MSIAYYDSTAIDLIIMFFMVVSSLHFGLFVRGLLHRAAETLNNPVVKFFLLSILVMTVLVTFSLKFLGRIRFLGKALLDAAFQVCSYVTTTGFGTADTAGWPLLSASGPGLCPVPVRMLRLYRRRCQGGQDVYCHEGCIVPDPQASFPVFIGYPDKGRQASSQRQCRYAYHAFL